jgi:predicted transcriptional regulator
MEDNMEYSLNDIRKIRKQLGITQTDLANKSGVSQSLIAKVESGMLDPGYSSVKKIFDTLDTLRSPRKKTAKDIMQRHLITITSRTPVKIAVDKMKKNGISQIPVIDNGRITGLVTESALLEAIANGRHIDDVNEIISEAPPTISENTDAQIVLNLLKYYDIVLVVEKGKFLGVITKADILTKMY